MAKLTLKCSADGTHEAYDGDRKVGEIEHDHLCDYAAKHIVGEGGANQDNLRARGTGISTLSADAYAMFASEVGAEGRTQEEIRSLVALALHPPKAEVTMLCESIGADGRLNPQRLDALDDSGRISRSAWRRAKDAEQRVLGAFQRGQITPAMMATGAPLRLALSDGAAFKSLVEDRPALYKPNSVVGIGGTGSETGESPRQLFSRLVEECLWEPEVALGPHLLARVRARVAIETLRRRRRARVIRTTAAGAVALLAVSLGGAGVFAQAQAVTKRALSAGPLSEALHTCVATSSMVCAGLPRLGLVGTLTLAALALAGLLFPVRDLFVSDPLKGLVPSAHRPR